MFIFSSVAAGNLSIVKNPFLAVIPILFKKDRMLFSNSDSSSMTGIFKALQVFLISDFFLAPL